MKIPSGIMNANMIAPLSILLVALLLFLWKTLMKPKSIFVKYGLSFDRKLKEEKTQNMLWYSYLAKIPILSHYIENIKLGLYIVSQANETELRKKTIYVLIRSMLLSLGIGFVILIFMEKTLYNLLVICFMTLYIFHAMVQSYLKNHDILLEQLPEVIGDLKHYFASERTMEKAYTLAIEGAPDAIGIHLGKILDILKQPYDIGKQKLRQYHEECPNKYLKILAAYSFLTMEYGDVIQEGESLFNKNMNYLIAEVRNEYRKKRLIGSALIGQRFFVISPLFLLPMLKQYILSYVKMPELDEFYNSSYGYLALLLSWFVTLFCYTIYQQVTNTGEYEIPNKIPKKSWEEKVLKNPIIRKIVTFVMPNISSAKYHRLMKKMERTGKLQKLEWFYLQKLGMGIAACILLFSVLQTARYIQVQRIYSDAAYGMHNQFLLMNTASASLEQQKQILENDKKVLEVIRQQKLDQEKDAQKLKGSILQTIKNLHLSSDALEESNIGSLKNMDVDRIYNKLLALKNAHTIVSDLPVIIVLSFLAYVIPNIKLTLSSYLQNFAMFDEVMSFQTIILLLMHHRRVTVEMILEWLIWFSELFRPQLMEAKNNFNDRQKGGIHALNKLKEDIKYKPFQQVIHNLVIAESTLSLKDAFAGLEQDQKFSLELRKDNTETIIQTKIAIASRIASVSTGFAMLAYLVVPLIYASYKLLTGIMQSSGL